VHGDKKPFDVPAAFVVPSEAPWPEEVWGMKLGRRLRLGLRLGSREDFVKNHPERRAELDALGSVWDHLERLRWEHVCAALLAYQEVHGDLEVPQLFVVPPEAPWPEEAWGMLLGSRVKDIRTIFARYAAEAGDAGLASDFGEAASAPAPAYDGDQALLAPDDFHLTGPWPHQCQGLQGYAEYFVKHHPERRMELDALGFRWGAL
jgi:hypothetical protein